MQTINLSRDCIQPPILYKNRSEWLGFIDFVHDTSFFVQKDSDTFIIQQLNF